MITKESLQEQLKSAEQELEIAKANVYRADAVIQHCKFLLEQFDKPAEKEEEETFEQKLKKVSNKKG